MYENAIQQYRLRQQREAQSSKEEKEKEAYKKEQTAKMNAEIDASIIGTDDRDRDVDLREKFSKEEMKEIKRLR